MSIILELIPIGLAILAIVSASIMYRSTKRKYDKFRCMIGILAACLMIIAQTSWYTTYVVMGKLEETVLANHIWTVFNSLVMILIIMHSVPRRYTPRENNES